MTTIASDKSDMQCSPHRVHSAQPTILFGCELGDGLGHVQKLLPLARALAEHGCRPVFAVSDLVRPWPLLEAAGFSVLQAPLVHVRPRPEAPAGYSAASYADILTLLGYDDFGTLFPVVRAWDGLLDLVRPALVVLDHSPTLSLAAHGRVPTVVVGTGFTLPPAEGAAFPALLPAKAPLVRDESLLAVIQKVQARRSRPAPASLPRLLAGAARFLCVLPEIDPYVERRRERCLGPSLPLADLSPSRESAGFFAYLSADYGPVEQVLTGLVRAGLPGSAYVRGATSELRARLRGQGLHLHDQAQPLSTAATNAAVIVHHGGCGTTQFALSTGRPQLLFPRNLEQTLTARSLNRLGVAHFLRNEFPARDVPEGFRQLAAEPCFRDRAHAVASDIQRRGPWNSLPTMIEQCLALLNNR